MTKPPFKIRSRRRAARAVLGFLGIYFAVHFGFLIWLDYGPPRVRDPEYGKRISRAKSRAKEPSDRPVVLVIGSSRTSMGVRPSVLADDPTSPRLVNVSLAGSGPVMERMALRRALDDGLKPDAVIVEFWPAFLRENGTYHEEARIDPSRLRPVDSTIVLDYFRDPKNVEKVRRQYLFSPIYAHRKSIMNQASPGWLGYGQRSDALWEKIDDWGWLPGKTGATPMELRGARNAAAGYYVPLFANYEVSPVADQALRDLVKDCRDRGIPVALFYLPEAAEFRTFMPSAVQSQADSYLAAICEELKLPLIDARGWTADDELIDGFHLTQSGAEQTTRKLGPAVTAAFPGLKRGSR